MKCLIINNPVSGHSKTPEELNEIIDSLRSKYDIVDIQPTLPDKNAEMISLENLDKGYNTYIVLGGDGTFNEVLRGIAGKENRPRMGYIPSGTVNDLARANNVPLKYKDAVSVILTGRTVSKNAMYLNGIPSASYLLAGLFSCVSYTTDQKKKRKIGKLAYIMEILFKDKGRKGELLEIEFNGEKHDALCTIVVCLNSKSIAGLHVSNYDFDNSDGFFAVIVKRRKGLPGLLISIPRLLRVYLKRVEKYKSTKHIVIQKTRSMTIKSLSDTTWNIDGEKGPVGDISIEYRDNQFEMILPR